MEENIIAHPLCIRTCTEFYTHHFAAILQGGYTLQIRKQVWKDESPSHPFSRRDTYVVTNQEIKINNTQGPSPTLCAGRDHVSNCRVSTAAAGGGIGGTEERT